MGYYNMEKDTNKEFSYKFYSIIVIILGVMDCITTVSSVIRGNTVDSTLTEAQVKVIVISSALFALWVGISKIYIGIQGLGKLKGKEVNQYTRVFTVILIVFSTFALIACIINLVKNISVLSSTLLVLVELFIWFMFRKEVIKN